MTKASGGERGSQLSAKSMKRTRRREVPGIRRYSKKVKRRKREKS